MQWREHEHRRLHREGLLTHPQQADCGDEGTAGDHCCGTECQPPEEEQVIAHKVGSQHKCMCLAKKHHGCSAMFAGKQVCQSMTAEV
jgi:hypothetical protein